MRRTTTSVDSGNKYATEIQRLRKELVHSRSKITDLQDELDEKLNMYLNAIKVSFSTSNQLPAVNTPGSKLLTVWPLLCAISVFELGLWFEFFLIELRSVD